MKQEATTEYPSYLQALSDFTAYLADQFEPLDTTERGQRFAEALLLVLPHLPRCEEFFEYQLNAKKSHDRGIDILSDTRPDGARAVCQSKLRISGTEELDSIISKFQAYENETINEQEGVLFADELTQNITYIIATGADLSGIRRRYEDRRLSSFSFYSSLVEEDRIIFIDGNDLLQWLRRSYARSTTLPASFELRSLRAWVQAGDVLLGVLSGQDVIRLVDEYGDGLFFENIREWLGSTEDKFSVNNSIMQTIKNEPERMLERNNGITVRCEELAMDPRGQVLRVERAAIVNGCQTTMCLWHSREVSDNLEIVVKVVRTPDSASAWSIAQSANYQNPVGRMELELARYVRPQLVTRAATKLGEGLKTDRTDSLAAVLRSYTRTEVTYALTRHMFLGIFCRRPNQLFQDNYTNVQMDALQEFFQLPDAEDHLYSVLFTAIRSGRVALDRAIKQFASEDYAKPFSRLLDADRYKYQAYLLLLALCATLRIDLSEPSEGTARARRIREFLDKADQTLTDQPKRFSRAYLFAYKELARMVARSAEEAERTQQRLSGRVKDAPFRDLYTNLCMELDSYDVAREIDQE
ncbi:AIPR family protein [Nonomuraea sp. NPDC050547]|uniref:AIPR family protein n=1 Tax=Nonomuraea sp. NPDC050547 TaxID=3364368 RepID=UPI0037AF3E0F